jgi:predicted ATPase
MLKELRLTNFKNFRNATLPLGPFTVLVGANASGKSNIRDAFRFLHGIGRGYNLAEILGEKHGEGGETVWRGIRGGINEIAFMGENKFNFDLSFEMENEKEENYDIKINLNKKIENIILFKKSKNDINIKLKTIIDITEVIKSYDFKTEESRMKFENLMRLYPRNFYKITSSMRFLDLDPKAMRRPSIPGQTILGDHGEYLSSVLHAICSDSHQKMIFLEWIKALTPMDAQDFEFQADIEGKILLTLVEKSGKKISAHSASDGTLRFLGLLAALLGPEPAKFYFFEEIDNGIHPTRLSLLLQLIESRVSSTTLPPIQIVATTHSPQLLGLLSPQSREHVSAVYRLEGHEDAKIKRLMDIPQAREVLETQNWAELHESGWIENALFFTEPEAEESQE